MKNKRLTAIAVTVTVIAIGVLLTYHFATQGADPGSTGAGLTEGTHYHQLDAPLAEPADGVSVVEFFWYGCPHCRDFEPQLKAWLSSAPDDVMFEARPVVWNGATGLHAAIYFAGLRAVRPVQLHEALFDKIIDLRSEKNLDQHIEQVASLFASHGIAADEFKLLINDEQISKQVQQSARDMRQAGVSSTPSLLVGGRYLVLNNDAVADVGLFNVVETLIKMAR